MPGAPSSFLLLVAMPLLLVAMPGAPSSFLLLVAMPLLLVAMPGAPSSFLFGALGSHKSHSSNPSAFGPAARLLG